MLWRLNNSWGCRWLLVLMKWTESGECVVCGVRMSWMGRNLHNSMICVCICNESIRRHVCIIEFEEYFLRRSVKEEQSSWEYMWQWICTGGVSWRAIIGVRKELINFVVVFRSATIFRNLFYVLLHSTTWTGTMNVVLQLKGEHIILSITALSPGGEISNW